MTIIGLIFELLGAMWEAISDSQADENPRMIFGCVSLLLLFILALVIVVGFCSGKLIW